MEFLPNGFTLELADGTFPLSTDSMVLSHFVRLQGNARILDLGAGCGTLGLLLCAKRADCAVTGIELDDCAHRCALENIRRNALEGRMESICADLRTVPSLFPAGSFTCCISNPPYFSGGPASKQTPLARREDCCSSAELFQAAAWALKFGGDFYLVHRPERLAELIARAAENGLEAKQLCLLRHRENGPISLILLQFRKGAKPGLIIDEAYLWNSSGEPSDLYKEIYHTQEAHHGRNVISGSHPHR